MELRNLADFFNSLPRDIDGNTEVQFLDSDGKLHDIDAVTMRLDGSGCFELLLEEE